MRGSQRTGGISGVNFYDTESGDSGDYIFHALRISPGGGGESKREGKKWKGMKIIFHLYIFPPSELQGMKIDVERVLLFLLDRLRYRRIS